MSTAQRPTDFLRIGELSRRTGLSVDLLRAWERRYGVLEPVRSPGGFRLYTGADEERVRDMQRHIGRGVAPAEAAMMVRARRVGGPAPVPSLPFAAAPRDPLVALRAALEGFDDASANSAMDLLIASFSVETLLSHVVLPYLREVGERWARGEVTVAQEHFASTILRTRLLEAGRAWDAGDGPRAVLACPPDELHDLGLIAAGLALRAQGWRITFIGANAPIATVIEAADTVKPDLVVVSAVVEEPMESQRRALGLLARRHPLAIGGAGASPELARAVGAEHLPEDPVGAARRLALEHFATRASSLPEAGPAGA
jgi:MerR family transcriptional regulator, light-induced transcriptional regulator